MAKMNPKKELFCQEYMKDLNATKAAERAGYSKKSVHSQGPRLLENAVVKKRLNELLAKRQKRAEITSDFVLKELYKLANVDLAQAYDESGKLKPIHEIPEDVRKAIAGVEVFEEFEGRGDDRKYIGDTVKVKFWDKPKVLEMLGRHLKLFTDKVEHSGNISLDSKTDQELEDRIKELEQRLKSKP